MKIVILNQEILDALISCGFRYCYSKTVADNLLAGQVNIFLTPTYFRPNIHKLPFRYDTYFDVTEEPAQMAKGIDEIIDDDADLLYIMKEALNYEGFEVITSTVANICKTLIRNHQVDLLLIDYLLAGVNGGEICCELKSCPEFAHLPVIIFGIPESVNIGRKIWLRSVYSKTIRPGRYYRSNQ